MEHKALSYGGLRRDAKLTGRAFELTGEEYNRMIHVPCHHCRRAITETNGSGVSRIDYLGGYTLDNMYSCCGVCKWMRGGLSIEEFMEEARFRAENYDNRAIWMEAYRKCIGRLTLHALRVEQEKKDYKQKCLHSTGTPS